MKNLYVVVGMPRSGTSAITRGLKALGVDLGSRLTPADEDWNAKGFFEDTEIVYNINRSLLAKEPSTDAEMDVLKASALKLLKSRIANTDNWGFKDPRTSLLLTFWQPIFNELNLNDHYVIALRNPLASAHSYQKARGTDLEEGVYLWLLHLIPAIEMTQGKKRVLVSYDALLENPRKQLTRMRTQLGIQLPEDANEINEYANQFLDKKLGHYEFTQEDLKTHPAAQIAPMAFDMYALLLRVASDEISLDSAEFAAEWQKVKAVFTATQPIYRYIDAMMERNKELERERRIIYKSIPWKMVYPLRVLDNFLRVCRRKIRRQKKIMLETE